jgi:Acetyltransferase (GNAT) domain
MTSDDPLLWCRGTGDRAGAPALTALGPHSLYACPRWMQVLEDGGRIPAAYLTQSASGDRVGLLPFHTQLPTRNGQYSASHLMRGLREFEGGKCAYGGALSAYQCEIPTTSGHDPREAISSLLQDAYARSVAADLPLVVPYLTMRTVTRLSGEPARSLVLEDLDCWFDAQASSLADYAAGLPRKRRQNLGRDLRLFRDAGLVAGAEPLADCLAGFARLVAESSRKYGEPYDEPGLAAHLTAIEKTFREDAVVFTARTLPGDLVGGVLGIFHEDELYLRMTGFDQNATARSGAYFQLVYYSPLDHRAARPHRRVHLGLELLRTKLQHGAVTEPLWTLILDPSEPRRDLSLASAARLDFLTRDLAPAVAARLRAEIAAICDPASTA